MEKWNELFDDWSVETLERVELDPWVVCSLVWRAKGAGSEAEVEWRVSDADEIQDGMFRRAIHNFPDLDAPPSRRYATGATLKAPKGSRN